MDKALALKALKRLDEKMTLAKEKKVTLVIGGGGSMILQHNYNGGTVDIDAVPINSDFGDIKPYMEEVARELNIAPDWLNPHYQAFTIYLPNDAKVRMQLTFSGTVITVKSLGAEEILIMKLMAGRAKDMSHIHHLLKMDLNLELVEKQLEKLKKLYPKLATKALERLDELTENL